MASCNKRAHNLKRCKRILANSHCKRHCAGVNRDSFSVRGASLEAVPLFQLARDKGTFIEQVTNSNILKSDYSFSLTHVIDVVAALGGGGLFCSNPSINSILGCYAFIMEGILSKCLSTRIKTNSLQL